MKKRKLILLLCISFTLCGCANTKNESTESTETITASSQTHERTELSGISACHNMVSIEDGPEQKFNTYPLYRQQDFSSIPYKTSNIANAGSLLTCMAMIESYWKSDYITPDILLNNYPELTENTSDESTMNTIAESNNMMVEDMQIDMYSLADYLVNEKWPVILEIPHASAFGQGTSYILLIGTTPEGNIIVRDPNQDNEEFEISNTYNEQIYTITSILVEAGNTSIMHTFKAPESGE